MTTHEPGLYWVKWQLSDGSVSEWELVEFRVASSFPAMNFRPNEPKIEIYSMGWDCPTRYNDCIKESITRAYITNPDGKPYM